VSNELAFPNETWLLETEIDPKAVSSLNPYLATAANIQEALNPVEAARILSNLSAGLAKCGSLLGAATFHMNQARAARKKAEAVVALDLFPVAAQQQGIKVTDKNTEFFVNKHPTVLQAKEREAFFEALYEKLSINRNVLTMAISSARAIAFGHRDGNMLSTTASSAGDRQ